MVNRRHLSYVTCFCTQLRSCSKTFEQKDGLWDIHLSSVSAMLPLIFVTNRVNYYRWMPVHILDMLSLPPEVVMHAPKDIEASLTKAFDNGATMAKSFVSDTLSEGKNGNFFGSISRSKLKTFEDLTKKTKLKCRSGDVVEAHINPELVFRRALVLAVVGRM